MKRTPQYLLRFYQSGDIYRASEDWERLTIIDNQLDELSHIVGAGVLQGWLVSPTSGLGLKVSIGSGFISDVMHLTLSEKSVSVIDNATSFIYMHSKLFSSPGGFPIGIEGPYSDPGQVTFVDVTPPAIPTNFQASAPSFDLVNLFWDANSELDFDHYVVQRSPDGIVWITIATTSSNGQYPNDPLQDAGRTGSTAYYYRIAAVDKSGNSSNIVSPAARATPYPITTPFDSQQPAQVTGLRLYPGNAQLSGMFNASQTTDVVEHVLLISKLNQDGTTDVSYDPIVIAVPGETFQVTQVRVLPGPWVPLQNNARYKMTVKAKRSNGVLNDGVSLEFSPLPLPGPLDAINLVATPLPRLVRLTWGASPSPNGTTIGKKSQYYVRVVLGGSESSPIKDIGLGLTKTIDRYNLVSTTGGIGSSVVLADDVKYAFRLTTVDSLGNESGGILVKSTTIDVTPPDRPRALAGEPGDQQVTLTWNHSLAQDVVDYKASYSSDGGTTWSAEVSTGYAERFVLSGLTNGVLYEFRLRALDDAGNYSTYVLAHATPQRDTTPPQIPTYVHLNAGDRQIKVSWKPVPDADFDHYVVRRQQIYEPLDASPNKTLTVIPGTEFFFNVGKRTDFVDFGLVNGVVYAYAIKAVDANGNESTFSATFLASPDEGINTGSDRLDAPFNVAAAQAGGVVVLTWEFLFPGQWEAPPGYWNYPANGPTNFNIYRSLGPNGGFEFLGSCPSSTRTFSDGNLQGLINGTTYYYLVSAVRDDADPLPDTGSIVPAHSVLVAVVRATGGSIVSITNSQRIIQDLDATLSEETLRLLLLHKHATTPNNGTTVDAQRTLQMEDINALTADDVNALTSLSPEAKSYYLSLVALAGSTPINDGTMFIIAPSLITWNVPSVGDFQTMVDGTRASQEFSIDGANNAIVFASALQATQVVSLDGLGMSFYVPTRMARDNGAFSVMVDGSVSPSALVDEDLQVVRFGFPLADAAVVSVAMEPVSPDFGEQAGARQVNLSSSFVLNDFVADSQNVYRSQSGAFDAGDTVFALLDDERTTVGYTMDFTNKAIVFDDPPPSGSHVSLEVKGREEVVGQLASNRLAGLDGSQFSTGQFLKAQLPDLSHAGRMKEPAHPLFVSLSSDDKYVFSSKDVAVGTGTTLYAIAQLQDSNLVVGTSNGLLKTHLAPGILLSASDDASVFSDTTLSSGIVFESNAILDAASSAEGNSGRVNGTLKFSVAGLTTLVQNPSIATLNDGRIIITGGNQNPATCFIYDPIADAASQVASMSVGRMYHACARLPDGSIMVSGGLNPAENCCVPKADFEANPGHYSNGTAPLTYLRSCERFDPISLSWSSAAPMSLARYDHAMVVIDPSVASSDVLVAGGKSGREILPPAFSFDGLFYCDCNHVVVDDSATCERYSTSLGTWRATGSLDEASASVGAKSDNGLVVFDGKDQRELYDPSPESWTAGAEDKINEVSLAAEALDGPIKQFLWDSDGLLYAVTLNNVFVSTDDGASFVKSKGLDAVGVVHRISEGTNKTLYAATDLGVYEMTKDIKANMTWFQGGLIGAGTTETFDLQPLGLLMLAATEIGLYSSSDDGQTWIQVTDIEDVRNIELIGTSIWITSGDLLYKSIDGGINWIKFGPFTFLNDNSILLARGSELFLGTDTGLYRTTSGTSFDLVAFDQNMNPRTNNVHMLCLMGSDVMVGYDNVMFSLGPALDAIRIAEFSGVVPTIRINGSEARTGFRYDVGENLIIFESKRLVDDSVDVATNYSVYQLEGGGWYDQRANAPIQVFVNDAPQEDSGFLLDSWQGRVAFKTLLNKADEVSATIIGTTLSNGGQYLHDELEDKMEREKGLPLSLGRDYVCDLLQMGVSVEHNFLERGIERDQYYCLVNALVDRSFNSFLPNSDFFILGRRDYDVFNSTLDYKTEASQVNIGTSALVALSVLENATNELWVGTDSGIFVLDQTNQFVVARTILPGGQGNPVRDLKGLLGVVMAVTKDGLFEIDGATITKNLGNGVQGAMYAIESLNNMLMLGTDNGLYYSESSSDPPYNVWFKADLVDLDGVTALSVGGTCASMIVTNGLAMAAIGGQVFSSTSGKVWRRIFAFDPEDEMTINAMTAFAERIYLATNKGAYDDNGTARSDSVTFRINMLEATEADSAIYANDVGGFPDGLYVVGNFPWLYQKQNERWIKFPVGAKAVQKFTITSNNKKAAFANNLVLVE